MQLPLNTVALPKKIDAEIAKNYLSKDEITTLNRIVSLYLDFAELQAEEHRPMYMKDWIEILDDFLRISRKDICLTSARQNSAHGLKLVDEDVLVACGGNRNRTYKLKE